MHNLAKLEKQQVGVRLHKYLIDEIDEFTEKYALNRTDVIVEAIKSYINVQKEHEFYDNFDQSCKEVKMMMDDKNPKTTLDDFINEHRNYTDA